MLGHEEMLLEAHSAHSILLVVLPLHGVQLVEKCVLVFITVV